MSEVRSAYATEAFAYIPNDWGLEELKTLVQKDKKITYGIVQPGKYDPNGVLLIRGVDYMNGWKDTSTFFKVSRELHQKYRRSIASKGDVLLSIAGYAGEASIIPEWIEEANLTQTTARMSCNDDLVASRYLLYFLQSSDGQLQSKRYTKGSAQEGLNLADVEKFLIPLPPLPEQEKIAAILTSVDEAIEKQEAQIAKLQDLKKAMMQELLTQGIGHTEFKDSPVGRIPKGWDIVPLANSDIDVVDGDRGKEYPKEKDLMPSGYCLFLSAKNVTKNGFQFSECVFISSEKDNRLRKGRLNRGDIVITTRGTVGNMAYFDESVPYETIRINSGMAILRNDRSSIDTAYFYQLLKSPVINQQLELLTFGSAQPQLTIGVINSLSIPLPPKHEQQKIGSIFISVDDNIEAKQKKLAHTKALKKALMQDLLTGKVRVKAVE